MSLRKWIELSAKCWKQAHKGLLDCSNWKTIEYIKNAFRFLFQTYVRDLPYIIVNELVYYIEMLIISNKLNFEKENIKDKVLIILIPWFGSTTWLLRKLKNEIKESWYDYIPVDNRIYFHNLKAKQKSTYLEVIRILKENKNRSVILFWYSHWWTIAHKIWKRKELPQVTYWTPISSDIPFTSWLVYYWMELNWASGIWPNELSFDITEQFSFSNPNPWERKVVKWEFSHFWVNWKKSVEMIMNWIKESLIYYNF